MDRLILGFLSMGKITIKNFEDCYDLEYQKFNKKRYLIISQKMWPVFLDGQLVAYWCCEGDGDIEVGFSAENFKISCQYQRGLFQ